MQVEMHGKPNQFSVVTSFWKFAQVFSKKGPCFVWTSSIRSSVEILEKQNDGAPCPSFKLSEKNDHSSHIFVETCALNSTCFISPIFLVSEKGLLPLRIGPRRILR
jgi:hypothetical protein